MTDEPLHDLAGAYVLGVLDPADRAAFERHLGECAACAAEVGSLQPVIDALARAAPPHDPRPELRERVLRAATGQAPTPAAVPTIRLTRRRAVSAPWLAAAAAAALVAIGLGIYVVQLRGRLADVEHRAALVLGAPDLLRVDLGSPAGTPAKARAFWSRSSGLVFTAVDLPRLAPGKVYQLWIVGPRTPVSAALLEPDAAGRATAVVEPSASLPDPAAFAVTVEPAGGMPQPTGEKILIGVAGG